MNALALLNNLEREFNTPFYRSPWAKDWTETDFNRTLPSTLKYDEAKKNWTLTIELAGVTKENIKIETENGLLRLSGEKTKGVNTGKFEGHYRLPEDIDTEKIEAKFEDGILMVDMPTAEKNLTKNIQIK